MEPEVIPLIGMRKTIAERMTYSYQSIPHIKFTERVDMTNFIAARKAMNAHAEKLGHAKGLGDGFIGKIGGSGAAEPPVDEQLADRRGDPAA